VIENNVAAAGKVHRTFAPVARDAFAKAQKAHDDIFLPAEGDGVPVKRDTLAGRGLALNREVAADGEV